MKAVVAMAKNRIIGKNNGLAWPSLPDDFKWFKSLTLNKDVVFGRTTYEGLPIKLKNRRVWVLSKSSVPIKDDYPYRVTDDINDLPKDCIVAGGAKIYEELLPYCSELYLSLINKNYEGDTKMPPFEHLFNECEKIKEFEDFSIFRYFKYV